jgi:hypothetical protein
VNTCLRATYQRCWKASLFGFALFLVTIGGTVRAADEEGLVALWKQHMTARDDHEAVIAGCRAFSATHASDPLLPVARGIEAWRTLCAGKREEALAMYEADLVLPPSPMNECARRLANGWMTRFDREKVAASLQAYYRKEVAYPKDLAQITTHLRLRHEAKPPETDRFGKTWNYTLTGFEKLKGLTDQKYSLGSSVLGDLSELKVAERLPYGARITAVPQRVITLPGNTEAVSFSLGTTSLLSMLGPGVGDLHLAFIGTKIIVVCDHTYWKIFPRP